MSAHRILGLYKVPRVGLFCPLKRYVSWVQTVVRQVGLYPLWALGICEELPLVREDRGGRSARDSVVAPAA